MVERVEQDVVADGEALVQPLLPGLGEEEVGLGLVGDAEAGEHPALERPLLEDGRAEGVDGRDLGARSSMSRAAARAAPLRPGPSGVGARALQPLPQAQLHGGGRVLGEGHGRDLVEPGVPDADEALDAVHEQGGLARARARLEHEARAVVAARALARVLVVDGRKRVISQVLAGRRARLRWRIGAACSCAGARAGPWVRRPR